MTDGIGSRGATAADRLTPCRRPAPAASPSSRSSKVSAAPRSSGARLNSPCSGGNFPWCRPRTPGTGSSFTCGGNAGVGKTSLVREWRQAAGEFGALVASADESADSVPDVLGAIAAQFAEQGHPLKALDRLLATHRRALHEAAGRLAADNEASAGVPSPRGARRRAGRAARGRGDTGRRGAGRGHRPGGRGARRRRAAGGVRRAGPAGGGGPAAGGTGPGPHPGVRRRAGPGRGRRALDRPVPGHLRAHRTPAGPVARGPADPGRYGELPANLVLTLAGQRRLDPAHWGDRGRLVADVPLGPFTEEEARQLLNGRGVVAEPAVREVLRLSGGLPVLVSTLAANPGAAGEANATAVERFLAGESDPARRAAAPLARRPAGSTRTWSPSPYRRTDHTPCRGSTTGCSNCPSSPSRTADAPATTPSSGPPCSGSSAPDPPALEGGARPAGRGLRGPPGRGGRGHRPGTALGRAALAPGGPGRAVPPAVRPPAHRAARGPARRDRAARPAAVPRPALGPDPGGRGRGRRRRRTAGVGPTCSPP